MGASNLQIQQRRSRRKTCPIGRGFYGWRGLIQNTIVKYIHTQDLGEFGIATRKLRTRVDFMDSLAVPGEKRLLAWERTSTTVSASTSSAAAVGDDGSLGQRLTGMLRPVKWILLIFLPNVYFILYQRFNWCSDAEEDGMATRKGNWWQNDEKGFGTTKRFSLYN